MSSSDPLSREGIIAHLSAALRPLPSVVALWLEGADGHGRVDEHSDIDLVIAVEDTHVESVFAAVEHALDGLSPIDRSYEEDSAAVGLRHRAYHLAGTRDSLMIDVVIQSRSRDFFFDPDHPDEIPVPIFDKAGVIRFNAPDSNSLRERRAAAWNRAVERFLPEARVSRYTHRGQYLEGMAAYQKYVLHPLVELLRLQHEPRTSGYGLVHVNAHLPADAIARLEALYRVCSVDDLATKLAEARRWFDEIVLSGIPR